MAESIDYGRAPSSPWRVWARRAAIVLAVFLLVSIFVPAAEKQVLSQVDAVTGTMTFQTTYPFGRTTPPRVVVSPLETRMRQMGLSWTSDWRFLHNTHRSMLTDRAMGYECGASPPAIYDCPHALLAEYVKTASDQEVRDLVRILQAGTVAQQRAALDVATETALAR